MSGQQEQITIANEFAEVRVWRVQTRNGVRLRVSGVRNGASIDLDALELEALTQHPHRVMSDLLAAAVPQGRPPAPADSA